MQLFEQLTSYFGVSGAVDGSGQLASQQIVFGANSTAPPQSLTHPTLPLGYSHLNAVSINNHAFSALPGEWTHDSLLTPFHSFTPSKSASPSPDLSSIRSAHFIAFDPAFFTSVLGASATLTTLHSFTSPDDQHVHEAPVYLPATHELLFADTSVSGWLWALDVSTAAIRKITTAPPLSNVNGGTSRCTAAGLCTLYLTTNGGHAPSIHACPLPGNFSTSTSTLQCGPLLNNFRSRKLNSPNDLIFTSGGDVLFTDPDYGWAQGWPGVGPPQLPNGVYRYSVATGALSVLSVGTVKMPNGLALSPDERTLYVADSGSIHGRPIAVDETAVRGVWAFDFDAAPGGVGVKGGGGGRVVHLVESGWPDGVRVGQSGLLFVAVVGGVDVVDVARGGVLLGKINVGDDVIYNLEPVQRGGKDDGVWLLTGKAAVYKAVIKEKGRAL
ncbi:uncharacterized protein HMPREF1541_04937 [Cyphellophora europaea CBS 101466]|uniref:SMP-30/Gluconolactonase/LRE-like region domain-containing protein n=1 Tax=Cyphellophora europaea (strain CBS 101466) TaxID=1220924 RepID=W2RXZ3_CYPE1|nr:uncharacterized protein HMPREF1541_04937 [Cyphellophora europaea CBS 101466]ETN40658.1 hypothetical protein HMPREF1541_04937 [Cyphellophora europaea CBS 101466]